MKTWKNKSPNILLLVCCILYQISCNNPETQSPTESTKANDMQNNMLAHISTVDLQNFKWLNEPRSFSIDNGTLQIQAEKGSDFFNNPTDSQKTSTAPFLYLDVEGDFVAKALVKPDFTSLWNAVALMIHIDDDTWIKFAFEHSDATGRSIVSVVTKDISDDANGVILAEHNSIWLKLVRKDNNYSMFWSTDGADFKMTRLCSLPMVDTVKIGIEAQSPVGKSAKHEVQFFNIEKTSVEDLRKGE